MTPQRSRAYRGDPRTLRESCLAKGLGNGRGAPGHAMPSARRRLVAISAIAFSVCAASAKRAPGRAISQRGQRGLLDGGPRLFLQVARQPTGRYARMAGRVFASDQHRQVERIEQRELGQVVRRRQGRRHVPRRWIARLKIP